MKILTVVLALLALAASPVPEADQKLERDYRSLPSASNIRENDRHLSAVPHHVGSPGDASNAQWMEQKFREWGLDAKIETFDVLFPTPKERVLELIEPTRFRAALVEPPVAGDPTSSQAALQLPTYNAYSIDGDVTAPLVYVNYGVPADYELLERMGVDVRGKIAIARYGASWRGIKPKVAAEHGAVACLIYSDPERRRLLRGRRVSQGRLPARGRSPARQRGGHAPLSGRPAHTRRGRNEGREAARPQGCRDADEDPRHAHLLCRRPAAARRPRRPGGPPRLARGAADHVPRRAGTGEGSLQDRFQLDDGDSPRRHRPDPGLHLARRVGHPRQPPRRLGERLHGPDERHGGAARRGPRPRRDAQEGLAAEAHHHPLRLGRRGTRPARLDRVGGDARARSSGRKPWLTSTPTRTSAGTSRSRARTASRPWPPRSVRTSRTRSRRYPWANAPA